MAHFNKKVTDNLAQLYTRYVNFGGHLTKLRGRYESIDRMVERSSNTTVDKSKQIAAAKLGRKDKMRGYEVPIADEKVDTLHTQLNDKLLSGYPVFAMTGIRGNAETQRVANMYTALMEQDQESFAWDTNLSDTLLDGATYNVMAVEVTWAERSKSALVTKSGQNDRAAKTTTVQGVRIRRVDPYNFIFDPTVPLHELHTRGVYAGYIERMNYTNVHVLLAGLQTQYKILENMRNGIIGSETQLHFYVPDLHPLEQDKGDIYETNWQEFFEPAHIPNSNVLRGNYEVVTLYVRVLPQSIGMDSPTNSAPVLLKLLYVGNSLVYAEPLETAHGGLPMFAAHLRSASKGFNVNSFAENLEDIQDTASSMLNASIGSMRRAVHDRGLYNPLMIDPNDINSPNPVAKIPVRLHGFNASMEQAYKPMPYEDRISQSMLQHMQISQSMADTATGINAAAQGNFTKGNRTMQEFNTIMSNSEGRLHKYALNVERWLFAQVKQAIKLLYMQYVSSQDIMSRTLEQNVKIEPVSMLQTEAIFKMADGMSSVSKLMSTDVVTAALTTIAQSPILASRYDIAGIFKELMMTQRFDISKYELQQQPQQPQQGQPPQ